MLNDFRNLGFNQAENGKIVFDGNDASGSPPATAST
jgi:hypothetical protein